MSHPAPGREYHEDMQLDSETLDLIGQWVCVFCQYTNGKNWLACRNCGELKGWSYD